MKRDTKRTGDISEIVVITAFIKAGYVVSVPFGENHRYDLIADKDGVLSRIQVKTGRLKDGSIQFNTFSSHFNRGMSSMQKYTGQIEAFGVFCPEVTAVFVVPVDAATDKGYLRWEAPRNGQVKKIRRADQFLFSFVEPIELVGGVAVDGVSCDGS